jgi:L-rhamnose mutarotase
MENDKNEQPGNPFPVDMDYRVVQFSFSGPRAEEDEVDHNSFFRSPPSHCPNCGDEIGRYVTPSPFDSGGLIVGLFIPESYLLCFHCVTDRAMIGTFPVWEKILELRSSFRIEKFEHDEFLRRELKIIESYVQGEELPSDAIQEIELYLAERRETYPTNEQVKTKYLDGETRYPYLRVPRHELFPYLGFGSSRHLAKIPKSEVVSQWNPRTQESTIQISAGSVLAHLDVAWIGETTALWFRAFTIRELLKPPAEGFIWPSFPDLD